MMRIWNGEAFNIYVDFDFDLKKHDRSYAIELYVEIDYDKTIFRYLKHISPKSSLMITW